MGTSASGGIGIGRAFVLPEYTRRIIPRRIIDSGEHESQWKFFMSCCEKVTADISIKIEESKGNQVLNQLYETYFLMLNDPEFIKELKNAFFGHNLNIEFVLDRQTEKYAGKLRSSGNEYLAERAQDICDIFGKVLDELLDYHPFNIECVPDGSVIVASQMNPSDTIILSKRKIAGLALTEGGVSSHVGILARNYGIPAVFALEGITSQIETGQTVVVDGNSGEVTSCPDEKTLADFQKKIQLENEHQSTLAKYRNLKAKTKDGVVLNLYANIGTVEEAELARSEGCDGIGLFRTEFLFMSESNGGHSNLFNEEAQFNAYRKVLEIMEGKTVTIRTLDSGGDKLITSSELQLKEEKNPLMGLRAIRLSLANPQQLKIQFRSLYRASVYGNLKIMLPLITDVQQVKKTLEIAQKAREELLAEGKPFNKDVPIGIMVETAAAALTADMLSKVSGFFSIGTNDLTQYTIGVDRENAKVAFLYDEFHPAVLRMIYHTINEGKKAGIDVSVCGEMASRKQSALVLAGMGLRNFSMSPKLISQTKELFSNYTISEMEEIAKKVLPQY